MTEIFPTLNEIKKQLEIGKKSAIITSTFPCDLFTPVSCLIKIKEQYPDYHFLFESVEKGNNRGRYSAIGIMPDLVWKCDGKSAFISSGKNLNNFKKLKEEPLSSLRKLIKESKTPSVKGLPSLSSGLFGYMAYDMVRLMEKLPDNNLPDNINIPDSIFIRPQIILVIDNLFDRLTICAPIYYSQGINSKAAYNKAAGNIEKIIKLINAPHKIKAGKKRKISGNFKSNFTEKEYCAAVIKAKEYIRNGDIFQVLPSQRLIADFDNNNSLAFYRALRSINPSPFLFYFQFPNFCYIGSSPEIMVSLRDKKVTIRPLAGTRKRGADEKEDRKLAAELLRDEKEIAEHLMLIDLGRHDVGRVCKDNTVEVTEKMVIENYSHVMHISSNVEGILRNNLDALDALISGFPAGTVSGAPKIRAMEIIEELEKNKRSFYAGCVGYFSGNGDMETCISLRCALIKDNKIHLQAGAGLVFDSNPKSEYQECLNKAAALIKAVKNIDKYSD